VLSGLKPWCGRRETHAGGQSPQGTAFTAPTRSYGDRRDETERASPSELFRWLGELFSSVDSKKLRSFSKNSTECALESGGVGDVARSGYNVPTGPPIFAMSNALTWHVS